MNELLQRLQTLIREFAGRSEVYWLLGLLVVLLIGRSVYRYFCGPSRRSTDSSPLEFDVETLANPVGESAQFSLRVYHVPVRLALVVIAPLGRDAKDPASAELATLLDQAVPGLGKVMERQHANLRVWPTQLSATGFVHSLSRQIKLPGDSGKNSPWCLVVGRVTMANRHFMLGLALCAEVSNNLSVIAVESEQKWLDVLRIAD